MKATLFAVGCMALSCRALKAPDTSAYFWRLNDGGSVIVF
jgi:hypothetical protein